MLRIALMPFIEQQRKLLGVRGQADGAPDPVWADVDSDSETEAEADAPAWSSWALNGVKSDLRDTDIHKDDPFGVDAASSRSISCSKAPPPTPSQSPVETQLFFQGTSVAAEEAKQAWPLSLLLPSDLETTETAEGTDDTGDVKDTPLSPHKTPSDSPHVPADPARREAADEQAESERQENGVEEEDEDDQEEHSGYMSSYDSCCTCTFEPTTATVEGYLTRSPSAHSLHSLSRGSLPSDQDGMSSYGSLELELEFEENGLDVASPETPMPNGEEKSPLTASATSSLTDRFASVDSSLHLGPGLQQDLDLHLDLGQSCPRGEQWCTPVQGLLRPPVYAPLDSAAVAQTHGKEGRVVSTRAVKEY